MSVMSNLIAVIGCFLVFATGILANQNNTRSGICVLEVPTKQLLSPQYTGPIPRGNGSREGFSVIEICCSGYEKKPHNHYECQPICENGCPNGNCTAPNVCVCKRGYEKIDGECSPICPIGCLHGVCSMRGQCDCDHGYSLEPRGRYCVPQCFGNRGCGEGGICVAPDTCKCRDGLQFNDRSGRCEYDCPGGCGNGTCVGPNRCSCQAGFVVPPKGGACVPDCPRGCRNGECTAPGICSCKHGYSLDPKTKAECVPHCSSPCLNGICSAPEVCTCRKGYVEASGDSGHKCVAFCEGGCPNGVCSAPNFCLCLPGFVKEGKGSNVCVRKLRKRSLHYELIPEAMLQGY